MPVPSEIFIKGVGAFRVAGHATRKPAWKETRVTNTLGAFGKPKPLQLANPLAGLTGARRMTGVHGPAGIAASLWAETSQEGIVGVGPKVTFSFLTNAKQLRTQNVGGYQIINDTSHGAGTTWGSPGYAGVQDALKATAVAVGATNGLRVTDFRFDTVGTIESVIVTVVRNVTGGGGSAKDLELYLVAGAVAISLNFADTATDWTVASFAQYVVATNNLGQPFTPEQVNAQDFGVFLKADVLGGTGVEVDFVGVQVVYSSPNTGLPARIWGDGLDDRGQHSRYIYCTAGSKFFVIDPTTDAVVETREFGPFSSRVIGSDAALWAGRWWITWRTRSGQSGFPIGVVLPYGALGPGSQTWAVVANWPNNVALHAGPDAFYRAYVDGDNRALVQKTTLVDTPVAAASSFALTGLPLDTETVSISRLYTFQTVLTNVDGHVLIGATASASIDNLIAAVNLGPGAGTLYAAVTGPNGLVTAERDPDVDTMFVVAIVPGIGGNSIVTQESVTNGSWLGAFLVGGSDPVALLANWAPTDGEQMGDPTINVTRLATLGERLVVGKEDGVGELDTDFTFRHYLEWMRDFRWEYQANGILPLGQSGDMIVTHRRGLHLLPQNLAIGVDTLPSPRAFLGQYTALAYDGTWIYAALEETSGIYKGLNISAIIKMRKRRIPGPGYFEHHPILIQPGKVLAFYLWPGGIIDGTEYGQRLYMGSTQGLGYINIDDEALTFPAVEWHVEWPLDDYGSPGTKKRIYRLGAQYAGVDGTAGIKWQVRAHADDPWVDMSEDGGQSGGVEVRSDGYQHRYSPKDDPAVLGRELAVRCVGSDSLSTVQQRIEGLPIIELIEQPEMVTAIDVTLELQSGPHTEADAEAQWQALAALGDQPLEIEARYAAEVDVSNRMFDAMLSAPSVTDARVVGAEEAPGVIFASLSIRGLEFGPAE